MSGLGKLRATSTPHLLDLALPPDQVEDPDLQSSGKLPTRVNNGQDARIVSESVLQKFRKTFSLRFAKKSESAEQGSVAVSPPDTTSRRSEPQEKYRFGPLVWRASKERKKTKAQRSAKCNSGDSGIQIEPNELGSCSIGGVDSCDEGVMDSDVPRGPPISLYNDETPLLSNEHPTSQNPRPVTEMSQALFERLKAELSRSPRHPNVRRAHSDLGGGGGGQRLLQWGANRKHPVNGPPSRPHMSVRSTRRMRRSLSQPDIDKYSPIFRPKGSHQLTDEERTSEDDCASDSGSSLGHMELAPQEMATRRHRRAHPIMHHSDAGDSHDSNCTSPTCLDMNYGCQMNNINQTCGLQFCGKSKYCDKNCEKCCGQSSGVWGEAVWDHIAMDLEELALTAGQSVLILDRHDNDWWWGQAENRTGWFPAAFVRLLVSQETPLVTPARSPLAPRHEAVRASVILELIHTERDFVNLLTDVAEGYIGECRRRPDMFSPEQVNAVFSNLEELLDFQRGFLSDLEQRMDWDQPNASCVGDAFLNHKSGFRLYSEYCNAHPFATATLQTLLTSRPHAHFLEACRLLRGMPQLPLNGHLLAPVQRICKYPLQLAELLKYTAQDHDDYNNIQEALSCMRGVAVLINERKRRMESLEKIAAWQQRVEGWEGDDLIELSSQLIHQGEALRMSTGMWSSSITLFLFDHQLIYCKKDILKRNTYIYKGRIGLDRTEIVDVPDGKDPQLGISLRHCFKLYCGEEDKWLVFCVRSANTKAKWLAALAQERQLVAADCVQGMRITSQAKRLAAMTSNKTAAGAKNLRINHYPSASLGRRVGTWFRRSKPHQHPGAHPRSHNPRSVGGTVPHLQHVSHTHTHSS